MVEIGRTIDRAELERRDQRRTGRLGRDGPAGTGRGQTGNRVASMTWLARRLKGACEAQSQQRDQSMYVTTRARAFLRKKRRGLAEQRDDLADFAERDPLVLGGAGVGGLASQAWPARPSRATRPARPLAPGYCESSSSSRSIRPRRSALSRSIRMIFDQGERPLTSPPLDQLGRVESASLRVPEWSRSFARCGR